MLNQQPITFDENVVLNYLCGSNIRNINLGIKAIPNGYDSSLITSETF